MQTRDFAFFHRGKIIRTLGEQEVDYLKPIDQVITPLHERALLLLHGFASSPAVYRAILPHLTGYDRIVCPVLPGHAQSLQAFAQSTAQKWRDAAHAHCATLINTYAQVNVVGFSMGGALALELSRAFPIQHLYLLAPALKLYYSPALARFAARALSTLGCTSLPNYAGDFYSKSTQYQELVYRRLPIPVILEILAFVQSQTYQAPGCPTDLFLGRHDRVVDSQTIAQQFAHYSQVQIHWLEHSAHMLPLDEDRDLIRLNEGHGSFSRPPPHHS